MSTLYYHVKILIVFRVGKKLKSKAGHNNMYLLSSIIFFFFLYPWKNSFFFNLILTEKIDEEKKPQSYDICVSILVVKTKVDTINILGTKLKNGAK